MQDRGKSFAAKRARNDVTGGLVGNMGELRHRSGRYRVVGNKNYSLQIFVFKLANEAILILSSFQKFHMDMILKYCKFLFLISILYRNCDKFSRARKLLPIQSSSGEKGN